jgi:serine/threonine-protein kinase
MRYTILRELGQGATGKVYAARDGSAGAVVALKVLDPALAASGKNVAELFMQNARSTARLRHRNIVRILDAGEASGTAYVAMELVEGESLRRLIDDRKLTVARAIRIFDDVASALAYAHEEGVVHRGVKPSNIIVLASGEAKLVDFGIGQRGQASQRYLSPEQVRGDPVDARSDLFSLGVVFYEMLARRAPFENKQSTLQAKPPRPSEVNPHVPGAVDAMVMSLLAANPDERPANARDVLRELQRLEEALGLQPVVSAVNPQQTARDAKPVIAAPSPAPSPAPRPAEPFAAIKQPEPDQLTLTEPFYVQDDRFMHRDAERQQSSGSRTAIFAALLLALGAGAVGGVFLYPDSIDLRTLASRIQQSVRTTTAPAVPEASPPPAMQEVKAVQEPPKPVVVRPPSRPTPVAEASKTAAAEPVPAPAPKALPPPPVVREAEVEQESPKPVVAKAQPAPKPAGTAKLVLAVSPQGDVYVDGERYGTTPPLTTLELEPGMRRIEIRSGSRKPYLTYMTVEAGDERRIRHDFDAKRIAPPR